MSKDKAALLRRRAVKALERIKNEALPFPIDQCKRCLCGKAIAWQEFKCFVCHAKYFMGIKDEGNENG